MFQLGDRVRQKNNIGNHGVIHSGPQGTPNGPAWMVQTADGAIWKWREAVIEAIPLGREVKDELARRSFGSHRDFSCFITYHRLVNPLKDNIYSMDSTKTDFYPHQFKPLLKLLDNPDSRLLIADEVGLGKTIEAGLILTELKARGTLNRILVVCPRVLCEDKWQMELQRRFNEDFTFYRRREDLEAFLKDWDYSGQTKPFRGILSMQGARIMNLRELFEEWAFTLDLTIIDEAHHMRNQGTRTHDLGGLLSGISECVLMLTATPLNLGTIDLFNLLRILNEESFPDFGIFNQIIAHNKFILKAEAALHPRRLDLSECRNQLSELAQVDLFKDNPLLARLINRIASLEPQTMIPADYVELRKDISELNVLSRIFNRTRKREVYTKAVVRMPQTISVQFTDQEKNLYHAIEDYVIRKYQEGAGTAFAAFILMMPQRQAASCLPAMLEHYRQEIDLLDNSEDPDLLNEMDENKAEVEQEGLKGQIVRDMRVLLKEHPESLTVDTKYVGLREFLQKRIRERPGEKIILFSTFRRTLAYLGAQLKQDGIATVTVHGGIDKSERLLRVEQFRTSQEVNMLLTSEVSSEGLDFQYCSSLINYDLPWNPMVVEQRIGRLDRLGQTSESITIVNFVIEGTIEQRILFRLYERIRIFEQSIGMLEGILGKTMRDLSLDILCGRLTPEAIELKMREIEHAEANNRQLMNELDQHAPELMGLDDYLSDEIKHIKKLHKYISREELDLLVTDYLNRLYPRARLQRLDEHGRGTYRLNPGEELLTDLRHHPYRHGQSLPLKMFSPEGCTITFNSETAEQHQQMEFIHVNHPFIDMIKRTYEGDITHFPKTVRLVVRTAGIPPGDYLFLVGKIKLSGVHDDIRLHCHAVNLQTGDFLSADLEELLFSEMLLRGEEAGHMAVSDLPDLLLPYENTAKWAEGWEYRLERRVKDRHETMIRLRMSNVGGYYDKLIGVQKKRRDKCLANRLFSQAKGAETRAANLAAKKLGLLNELESRLVIHPESCEIVGGVVYVRA